MQYYKFNYWIMPIIVGLTLGVVAGIVSVFGGKILALNFTEAQEYTAFIGFTIAGLIFGLADVVSKLLKK